MNLGFLTDLVKGVFSLFTFWENRRIELVSAGLNTDLCDWSQYEETPLPAFYLQNKKGKVSPVFDFTFFNHWEKPILLIGINIKVKGLPLGLSGIPTEPTPIIPFAKYVFSITKPEHYFRLNNPVQLPAKSSFRFQVELLSSGKYPLVDRYAVYFCFTFNDRKSKKALVLLNSTDKEGTIQLSLLS